MAQINLANNKIAAFDAELAATNDALAQNSADIDKLSTLVDGFSNDIAGLVDMLSTLAA